MAVSIHDTDVISSSGNQGSVTYTVPTGDHYAEISFTYNSIIVEHYVVNAGATIEVFSSSYLDNQLQTRHSGSISVNGRALTSVSASTTSQSPLVNIVVFSS